MRTPDRVKEIRSKIKSMKDGSIVGVTSSKSHKSEKYEMNVSNSKVSKFDSVYKIIYSKDGQVQVLHTTNPQLLRVKAGKTKSQTRVVLSGSTFRDITTQFVG